MKQTLSAAMVRQVEEAVAVLRSGGLVAYPTDTIYGLGADIYNDDAVRKVFTVKERPLDLPFPVLISDLSQLCSLVAVQTALSKALIAKYWPGGLTIIFNKAAGLNSLALAGSSKIGIRMPAHPVALFMIGELGRPVVGTSANLHGGRLPLTADDVRKELSSRLDYIIDAGRCPGGIESTILDTTVDPPQIVRKGIIPEDDLMAEYMKTMGGK